MAGNVYFNRRKLAASQPRAHAVCEGEGGTSADSCRLPCSTQHLEGISASQITLQRSGCIYRNIQHILTSFTSSAAVAGGCTPTDSSCMEGYTLSRERKVPKNTKRGVCMACGSTAPALHATPHWYSFSLHKAAAATTWQCRLGAQEVRGVEGPAHM